MPLSLTTITLSDGTTTVTLRATAPETAAPTTVPGVVHRTQGGSLVSYQVGPQYWEVTLQCRSLTSDQKDALNSLFGSSFAANMTYTDENGNAFAARFLDTALQFKKRFRDCFDVDVHLNLSACLI